MCKWKKLLNEVCQIHYFIMCLWELFWLHYVLLQNNSEFYADFETVEKNAKKLLTKKLQAKEVCKIGVCPLLFYYSTSFWQITFYRYTFLKLFPRICNQRKILLFYTHMLKKKYKNFGVMEYIYEYFLEIVECKHFKEYYFASYW